jgi:8-oxo-dGTP pyrophosphatase MutT (NUDIX family)
MTFLHLPLVAGASDSELPWKARCGVHVAEPEELDAQVCPECVGPPDTSVEDAINELDDLSINGLVPQEEVRRVTEGLDPSDQYNLKMDMVQNGLRVTNAAVNVVDREEPMINGIGDAGSANPLDLWSDVGQSGFAEDNSDPGGTDTLDFFRPMNVEGQFGAYVKTDLADPSPWGKLKLAYETSAGAGVLLYCPDDSTVFLAKRAEDVSEPGTWCVPGGGVEPSDSSPAMAAIRECDEEVGGVPDHLEPAGACQFIDGSFTYTTYAFEVDPADKRRWVPHLNVEHSDCGWFPVDQLPEPLHFGMDTIIEDFPEIFSSDKEANGGGNNLVDLTVASVGRSPLGPDTGENETSWGWKGADNLIPGPSNPFRSEPGRWTDSYHNENQFEDLDHLGCISGHKFAVSLCSCCSGLQAVTPRQACYNCSGFGCVKRCLRCSRVAIVKSAARLTAYWRKRADAVKQVKQWGQIPVHIEWKKGESRQGIGEGGKPWERLMHCDYGFIPGTVGDDQEPIDVYLGGANHPVAYVVSQLNKDGSPDEKKVMLGFESPEMAEAMYRAHYPNNGDGFFGGMEKLGVDSFINSYFPQSPDPYKIDLEADATNQEWLDNQTTQPEAPSKASAGQSLRDQSKHDPALASKLKGFTTPGSDMEGFAKANPDFPADKLLKGIILPPGIKTLGDVQEALLAKPEPKPKKKKQGPVPLDLSDKAKPAPKVEEPVSKPKLDDLSVKSPTPEQSPKLDDLSVKQPKEPVDQAPGQSVPSQAKPNPVEPAAPVSVSKPTEPKPQETKPKTAPIPKNLQDIDTKEIKTPAEQALEKDKGHVQQTWNQLWNYLGGDGKHHGSLDDLSVAVVARATNQDWLDSKKLKEKPETEHHEHESPAQPEKPLTEEEEISKFKQDVKPLGHAIGLSEEAVKAFKKLPPAFKKFLSDPVHRKAVLTSAAQSLRKAPKGYVTSLMKTAKEEVHEFKLAGTALKSIVQRKPLDEHQKKALKTVAFHVALSATVAALSS